jgi:DNA-binding NarL/FixJ family response regulator
MRPRLLLADDHSITGAGMRSVIGQEHEVVGTVSDGRTLVIEALRLRPQLIIVHISMPLLNAIDAPRKIRQKWPQAKLLFVGMNTNAMYVREAMSTGAFGYILKTSAAEDLLAAIRTVLESGVYMASSLGPAVSESKWLTPRLG